jgi:SNF2 family DNA or RNA helicase
MATEPHIKLERYQVDGVRHLMQRPMSGLIWDPGVAKTATILSAFHILRRKDFIDKMVVVAPMNPMQEVWGPGPDAEIAKWGFPFRSVVLHGHAKDKLIQQDADLYVLNYEGLAWLLKHWGSLRKRHRWWLVLDESTKVKRTNTKRFKMLKPMLGDFARRSILTGTPSPNGLLDLFGQVYACDGGASLGRYITYYRREYFTPCGFGGFSWEPQEDAEERIYKKLQGVMHRVSDSVLKLKPIRYVPLLVELPDKARKVYDSMENDLIYKARGVKLTAVNAGVMTVKLRQIAGGAVYDADQRTVQVHDAKVTALTDLAEQLQGHALLVGYEFTHHGEALIKAFKKVGMRVALIKGRMHNDDKAEILKWFNNNELDILVCQADAAAHGLNLQKVCHNIAWFGMPWNLETYLQFIRRVHRKGQKKAVVVHHVIAKNTVDSVIADVLQKKDNLQQRLLAAIKARYMK